MGPFLCVLNHVLPYAPTGVSAAPKAGLPKVRDLTVCTVPYNGALDSAAVRFTDCDSATEVSV